MHPILGRVRHSIVYLAAAVAAGAVVAAAFEAGGDRLWIAIALLVPGTAAYAAVCLSTWYLCKAFPIATTGSLGRIVFVHGLASVLASSSWGGLLAMWGSGLDRLLPDSGASNVIVGRGPALFVVGILLYWLAAAMHYLLIAVEDSRAAERRALDQQLMAKEAELRALRAQIDPHFMFNSLHSISALTTTNPTAARRMALLLADFLRDTLRLGALHRVSLADEFTIVDRFLAIEQIRFGSRLGFERVAAPDVSACLVPPLLLQPLVENAVVHGVSQLVDGGTITLKATRTSSLLTLEVENPCDPDRARTRGVGLGLELLRRRLMTQYGFADAVQAAEHEGRFRVEVRLPVELPS